MLALKNNVSSNTEGGNKIRLLKLIIGAKVQAVSGRHLGLATERWTCKTGSASCVRLGTTLHNLGNKFKS